MTVPIGAWWRALVEWWKTVPPEVNALLGHPLVVALISIGLGGTVAYFLTERWQRWRQRREFQHRALVRFSEFSGEAIVALSHLLISRGRIREVQRRDLALQHIVRRAPLLAMDSEFFGVFRNGVVLLQDLVYLKDLMHTLLQMAFAAEPARREVFEAVQRCMTAQRRVVVTLMLREMRFISRREERQILPPLQQESRALPEGVTLRTEDEPALLGL